MNSTGVIWTLGAFLLALGVLIVVHELAHLKESEHNKAFYQLCQHMEAQYFQLEFDLRLYLTHLDLTKRQIAE